MRQILIGVTLALAYASFAIPIVGGFISVPFFAIAGILTGVETGQCLRLSPSRSALGCLLGTVGTAATTLVGWDGATPPTARQANMFTIPPTEPPSEAE
jgi:hypothetical protein